MKNNVVPFERFQEVQTAQDTKRKWAVCMRCGRQWLAYGIVDEIDLICPNLECNGDGQFIIEEK